MYKKLRASRVFILAVGLVLTSIIATAITLLPSQHDPTTREIAQIPGLELTDPAELADMLDRSMVAVPAGTFIMGSEDGAANERPRRSVYLDAYQIDRYEVTNAQYQRFVEATGAGAPRHWAGGRYPGGQADQPVVGVSWDEAGAYCSWIGKRLPTEAEWEKACRGTEGRVYPWGNAWQAGRANVGQPFEAARPEVWDEAWAFLESTPESPVLPSLRPIGSYPAGASPFGVMDMAGNAAEWVADWYNWSDYTGLPDRNPQGTGPAWNHSVRGSSWYLPYGDVAEVWQKSRCSARNASHAGDGDARLGFRCARTGP